MINGINDLPCNESMNIWRISGTEYENYWNWFGENKYPLARGLSALVQTSRPWVSGDNESSK